MHVKLLKPTDCTPKLQNQLTVLYLQLNDVLTQRKLEELLREPEHIDVAACFMEDKLIGIAMMAKYTVISGHKGMIEDVVVATDYRGKGIGRQLMEVLLLRAKECSLDDVLLFSGHHRTAAISLYKSLGFTLKNSGMYIKKMAAV